MHFGRAGSVVHLVLPLVVQAHINLSPRSNENPLGLWRGIRSADSLTEGSGSNIRTARL